MDVRDCFFLSLEIFSDIFSMFDISMVSEENLFFLKIIKFLSFFFNNDSNLS